MSIRSARRAGFLPTLALPLLIGCAAAVDPADPAERAAAWLWEAQGKDGGWHSAVHGLARSGQSWTAFALFHLLDATQEVSSTRAGQIRAALAFLEANVETGADGQVALGWRSDAAADYPVYATAFALRAFVRAREMDLLSPTQERLVSGMARYLLAQQHRSMPDSTAYGGWGFGARPSSDQRATPRTAPPYADVAHTRRALEALAGVRTLEASLAGRIDSAFAAAAPFLARLQKRGQTGYDGGFFYSPTRLELNKAGTADAPGATKEARPLSYATATCDGLLALLAIGARVESAPVRDARAYLAAHDTLQHAAGLPEARAVWRDALFYYHLAGRAKVDALLPTDSGVRERIIDLLRDRQRADGSFVNPHGAPNREDDPIIATALALSALSSVDVANANRRRPRT